MKKYRMRDPRWQWWRIRSYDQTIGRVRAVSEKQALFKFEEQTHYGRPESLYAVPEPKKPGLPSIPPTMKAQTALFQEDA